MRLSIFNEYLQKWHLAPDGASIITHSSRLLPVRHNGLAAMLKISLAPEEKSGALLMEWWDGVGAARVLAHEGNALLLERAQGARSLSNMAREGNDDEATGILCASLAVLHHPRDQPPPQLVPLSKWFTELFPTAQQHGGVLTMCAKIARDLLAHPQNEGVLHGDIHHDNILDFGARGWLAIDPKALWGERTFDYANLFCNPDRATATSRELFLQRLEIVTEQTGVERKRLLHWILAWSGLSTSWLLSANTSAERPLTVATMAATELQRLRE